jgi:DNA-binding GntR family transcriptional regulator
VERPDTLVAAVATEIRNRIIRGELRADARLPEITLATRLEVSRTTIREALRSLADDGLVEIHPHRGAVVAGITLAAVKEIYQVRTILETFAAREAVAEGPLSPAALIPVRDALEQLRRAATENDLLKYGAADVAFHQAISTLCGNSTLLHMLTSLQARRQRYVILTNLPGLDLAYEAAGHAEIFEALEAGQRDQLGSLVEDHIRLAGVRLLERTKSLLAETGYDPGLLPHREGTARRSLTPVPALWASPEGRTFR